MLDVSGRAVVVVGGGPVAARRALGLVEASAVVTVIAPEVCPDLRALVQAGSVRWLSRAYASGDLTGAWLAHTATGDRDVDALVSADAERARIWCVRADDAHRSPAWTPAVARVDDVTVAVSANADPLRAKAIRAAIAALLETAELPIRRARRHSRTDGPRTDGRSGPRSDGLGRRLGSVALVGGGPGDPGLITTRGRRLLADADVVVVDRLAPRALLDVLAPGVEIVEAGKGPDAHHLTQLEINAVLVDRARAGDRVVRLKGGDPFVLGRGGEEVRACAQAGIPCEVVPGVTSAVAVPGAAGIPVTHRGLARSFTVVSAHTARPDDEPDWAAFARVPGTLVVLMGVRPLGQVTESLVRQGKPASTPAAVVERGTLPGQRTTVGRLDDIAARAERRGVRSPAVVVIGEVVSLLDADPEGAGPEGTGPEGTGPEGDG